MIYMKKIIKFDENKKVKENFKYLSKYYIIYETLLYIYKLVNIFVE